MRDAVCDAESVSVSNTFIPDDVDEALEAALFEFCA